MSTSLDSPVGPIAIDARAATLGRNLAALEPTNPGLSAIIRAASARPDAAFAPTDEGVPTCTLGAGQDARQLASRRRPMSEARTLVSAVDPAHAAVCVVMGFGVGHHVATLHEKLGQHGLIVVFEPDAALLRAVLEHVDHSTTLRDSGVRILTDAHDQPAMMAALRGAEGLVGMGVKLIDHPPSVQRLGADAALFARRFVGIVDAVRLTVVTTLVQTRVTFRNLLQNVDRYAATPGVADLVNICAGAPGIVVSAGPSLARNIALLTDPRVRERFVIVAAQTVLRPLLERGIRPHFVTALDFSEVSARFYEGLSPAQVHGITLVAEAKVNPGVPEAWARLGGALRILPDGVLDALLGESVKDDAHRLPMGATVAHLAYALARHLGCEPVALVGQDLGFTDGQYYAAGAAIHNTWAGELNEFNTLEMLEHQRIMRMGSYLRRETDVLGRPIYTDEQMLNYLRGFEELFAADARRGLTTIDATEGGVKKAFTICRTLAEFLAAHSSAAHADIPATFAQPPRPTSKHDALHGLEARLTQVQRQCSRLSELSAQTAALLSELIEHQADLARADRVIAKIDRLAEQAVELKPGFVLVQQLGQSMVFNRLRADRLIGIDSSLTPMQRQEHQARRDLENVRSTGLVSRRLGEMIGGALRLLRTGERDCGDISAATVLRDQSHARDSAGPATPETKGRIACVVPVDTQRSGLGAPRRLDAPIAGASSVLAATIRRARAIAGVDALVLITNNAAECRRLLEGELAMSGVPIDIIETPPERLRARANGVARARAWARACYRGGIANLTCFDELYEPGLFSAALTHAGAAAGLLIGPDWCALDASLCAAVIERFHDEPARNRLVFTQAVPGLCGCVLAADLASDMARPASAGRAVSSIGGLMSYRPEAPAVDILGLRMCVAIDAPRRDAGHRLIAESSAGRAAVEARLSATPARLEGPTPAWPLEITLDARVSAENRSSLIADAIAHLAAAADEPIAVTLLLDRPAAAALPRLIAALRAGPGTIRLHARLAARDLPARADWLTTGVDVLSIDADPDDTGAAAAIDALLTARRTLVDAAGGDEFSVPWVVPRLTRRDATYPAVEGFVRSALTTAGWCVLDPLDAPRPGERIAPLPLPVAAARRLMLGRLAIRADGRVLIDPRGIDSAKIGMLPDLALPDAWRLVLTARGLAGAGA